MVCPKEWVYLTFKLGWDKHETTNKRYFLPCFLQMTKKLNKFWQRKNETWELENLGVSNFFLPYFLREGKNNKFQIFSDSKLSDLGTEKVRNLADEKYPS